MVKIRHILLVLTCFLVYVNHSQAQIIKYVDNKYQADVIVYFTEYEYQADIVVYRTSSKYSARNNKGWWYWPVYGKTYDIDAVKVYKTPHKYQADYVVYITKYQSRVKVDHCYLLKKQ